MNIHGGDIYSNPNMLDFSTNINPLGTPESVILAAKEGVEHSGDYPDIQCRELVRAIARKEGLCESQIICGNGAADLIFSLVLARKPKRALLTAPTFAEYEQALHTVGCEVDYYYLSESNGFQIDEGFPLSINQEHDMVFICNPNNPTGEITRLSIMNEISRKAEQWGALLVIDECFMNFIEEEASSTFQEQIPYNDNLFLLKAFTKMYGMAGLRLGYGLTSNLKLIQSMHLVTQPWNVSIPAQKAGIAALSEVGFTERTIAVIKDQRENLITNLEEMGFRIYGSKANFIFFHSSIELFHALKRQAILIRDCGNYRGLMADDNNYYYRIAVKEKSMNDKLIEAIRKVIALGAPEVQR